MQNGFQIFDNQLEEAMKKLGTSWIDLLLFTYLFSCLIYTSYQIATYTSLVAIWGSWVLISFLLWAEWVYRGFTRFPNEWSTRESWIAIYFVFAFLGGGFEWWHRLALTVVFTIELLILLYLRSPRHEEYMKRKFSHSTSRN